MFEIFVLIIISMIIGGAIAQKEGMKALYLLVGIILIPMAFYGGRIGLVVSLLGEIVLLSYWFISSWSKPISSLYVRKSESQNKKVDSRNRDKDELVDMLRKNFQANMESKYGPMSQSDKAKIG